MKVHFFGSLTGNKENYRKIIKALKELGHSVITEHSVSRKIQDITNETPEESEQYVKKMTMWMKKAETIVVEVSEPDLGTGYELAIAQSYDKPIVALYTEDKDINVLIGQAEISDRMQAIEYDPSNLKKILKRALDDAKDQMDVRFNFFVSPKIVRFLDWVSKKRKMPRAVYLRRLIEADMKKIKDYQKEV